ncbi:hypothetical protein LOTGIDRAFT_194798 [Lottia gigantea]|uniref:F-box domain-containing protein n=1 Tax=Lottia gigantea TaxID=225164 RepID=V3ZVL6_LOTGI|nr:hypothetical protein LOTGIDRAFT_194798 [Lottia gigantea]ESO86645.1 hypothetical protein LOTGIDRAFT_194798 [Lottia gigantea]
MDFRTYLLRAAQLFDEEEWRSRDKSPEEEEGDTRWGNCLPEILLEDIFSLLVPKHRHEASQVCRTWYQAFYAPRVWGTFVLMETTLTKRRFNLYKGYQRELCPRKTQVCLQRVGHLFKKIIITPLSDFYNLYEFLRVLSAFLEYYEEHEEYPMPLLKTFDFTFACENRGMTGSIVHGTGGKILQILETLLGNMIGLKHVSVNQLLLGPEEVPGLMESLAKNCAESLQTLELLNCCKVPYPMSDITQFGNLHTLTISPQHLDDEMLLLLAGMGLGKLHIVQDAYTCDTEPINYEVWKLVKEMAPNFRVSLSLRGLTKKEIVIQPHAPVYCVVYRAPYSKINLDFASSLCDYYPRYLEVYAQEGFPRSHGSRSFVDRGDTTFVHLVRICPRLKTLVIRERISYATLLIIASLGKNLENLVVRENALIKKMDWPMLSGWTDDFYRFLKKNSKNLEDTTREVSMLLKKSWKPLRDEDFKKVSIKL